MARSEDVVTGVTTVADPCDSSCGVETVAVLDISPPEARSWLTFTTIVKTADAPSTRDGFVQVKVPVPPAEMELHVHPAGEVNETRVVPAGIASVNVSDVASLGAVLFTVIVYVMFSPAATVSRLANFVMATSADAVTGVTTVDASPVGSSAAVTVAVFDICPPEATLELTFTTRVKTELVSAASDGFV